jgi:hypothetical protein
MKRPEKFSTRAAGALGYNDTFYSVPGLPSPLAAAALSGTAGAAAGHFGGFALDDVVNFKREQLEAEETAAKARGDQLRKDKQFMLEALRMLGGQNTVQPDGSVERAPYVWSKRLALTGGIAAAAPAAVMSLGYLGAGHNPLSREAVKWDEDYVRPDAQIKIKPANKTGGISGLAPFEKQEFITDMYGNPYMGLPKKKKIEAVIETASGGQGWVLPTALGVISAASGGSFAAGVLGGAVLSCLTGQPKKTKVELQIDGTYNDLLNSVF